MRKEIVLCFLVIISVILTGCGPEVMPTGRFYGEKADGQQIVKGMNTADKEKAIEMCKSDEECIPKPGCHAKTCINKLFKGLFEQESICTSEFYPEAAYASSDCLCVENNCVNKNLK